MGVFQLAAVENVIAHTGPQLEEQGITASVVAEAAPAALVGVASDGRDLGSLLTLPDLTEHQFDRIVATQLQDVARQAASIERAVRPEVTHYVRALNLPSCGRCIVLAGIPEASEVAFQRHPRCDCLGVPTTARRAGRIVTDPREAFERMSQAERERAFTKAGAEAIGLGADVPRVVNARRGMAKAQSGRAVRDSAGRLVTEEGMFAGRRRPGVAARQMRREGVAGPRLMPETIAEYARDRDDHLRLLRAYAYIT